MSLRDLFLALIVVSVWGLNFVAVKVGVHAFPPFFFCAVRFSCVAALVVPFYPIARAQFWPLFRLSTVLGGLHFGLFFFGMHGVDAATTAILIQLGVPFSTLLAVFVLKERLNRAQMSGLVLAFGGAIVLAGEPTLPGLTPFLLLLASAFCWAWSNLMSQKIPSPTLPPLALVGWVSLLAAPQVGFLSLLTEHHQWEAVLSAPPLAWGVLVYVVLGSSMTAYTAWYFLLARYPVSQIVPFTLLAPVIGVLSASALLGEALGWQKIVGGLLTMSGVAIILRSPLSLRKGASSTSSE